MSLFKQYASTIFKQINYRATWLPDAPLALGDVGTVDDGVFNKRTSLESLGISFDKAPDEPSDQFNFDSAGVRSVVAKAAGEVSKVFEFVGDAKAGFRVEFESENAVVIRTKGARIHRVADIRALDDKLITVATRWDANGNPIDSRWNRDWVVVTEVVDTDAGTVLCSTGSQSSLEVEVEGQLAPHNLIDVGGSFATKLARSVGIQVIASSGITPLYRARRVRENWLWLFDEVVAADIAPTVPPKPGDDVFEDDFSDITSVSEQPA
jgi:hypothetical protein